MQNLVFLQNDSFGLSFFVGRVYYLCYENKNEIYKKKSNQKLLVHVYLFD